MHVGELDPGLHGQVRYSVGERWPQPLRADKLTPRRREVPPVHRGAGEHRGGEQRLHSDRAKRVPCLGGQDLRAAPVAVRHRQQRPLAQRVRLHLVRANFVRGSGGVLQERVTAVTVIGQNAREGLAQNGYGHHGVRGREPPHRLVRVGAHLFDAAPAHDGPDHGGPGPGDRVVGS